jgi:hypothetical protein
MQETVPIAGTAPGVAGERPRVAAEPPPRVAPERPRISEPPRVAPERPRISEPPLRTMRTRELVTELARKASLLARKEVELAKAELKADVRAEIKAASGLGVAGLCAILTIQLLLVAVVLALMEGGVMPGWAAALLVGAVVLAVGTAVGLWGWAKRVRKPLDTTRRSLQEDVRWAKEQIA